MLPLTWTTVSGWPDLSNNVTLIMSGTSSVLTLVCDHVITLWYGVVCIDCIWGRAGRTKKRETL